MEGAARVFAGEFCRSTLCCSTPGQDSPLYVVTPSGAWCNRVFITGALTELTPAGAGLRGRLADPTGVFDLTFPADARTDLTGMLRKVPIPSFLSVNGKARMAGGSTRSAPFIVVDSFRIVDRAVRDAWVARTAEITLQRIGALAQALRVQEMVADGRVRLVLSHYRTTPAGLLDCVAMVESAIAGLPATPSVPPPPPGDIREPVIGIIRDLQGAKGVAIADVIAQAGIRGIPPDAAQGIVDELIREDECYQPQKGVVRLL